MSAPDPGRRAVQRAVLWFLGVAVVHFLVCHLGLVLSLTAAFATQSQRYLAGLLREPVAVLFAFAAHALLLPVIVLEEFVPLASIGDHLRIALASAFFGSLAAATSAILSVRRCRARRLEHGSGSG